MEKTRFRIGEVLFDPGKGTGIFTYDLINEGRKYSFKDAISFPIPQHIPPDTTLRPLLDTLAVLFGISYWKLFAPDDIELSSIRLTPQQADFWNAVYTIGLGEFYYKNKLDFRNKRFFAPTAENKSPHLPPEFLPWWRGFLQHLFIPVAEPRGILGKWGDKPPAKTFPRKNRSLLLLGGGKDSIVAGELLKKWKEPFDAFIVNPTPLKMEVAKAMDAQAIAITHHIDQQLFELNKRPDVFNGHIPISLTYTFLGVLAAFLYDYQFVIASNEASANYGNENYLGKIINHQWSKTEEVEHMVQDYLIRYITPDINYFSLLRPFSEIEIAERFAAYSRYFDVFSSCNRNFQIAPGATPPKGLWCNSCPKCAFVFALLAAFLPKKTVMGIFGENLFAKTSLLHAYQELLGLGAIKPFECVGTPEETQQAFALAHERGGYDETEAMKLFLARFGTKLPALISQKNNGGSNRLIPERFKTLIQNA